MPRCGFLIATGGRIVISVSWITLTAEIRARNPLQCLAWYCLIFATHLKAVPVTLQHTVLPVEPSVWSVPGVLHWVTSTGQEARSSFIAHHTTAWLLEYTTQYKNLHLPFPSECRSFSCRQAGLFSYYVWQDDWKPWRPTFSRLALVLQGVPLGIHMQIAWEMTDVDEGGEGGLLLTRQGPTYPWEYRQHKNYTHLDFSIIHTHHISLLYESKPQSVIQQRWPSTHRLSWWIQMQQTMSNFSSALSLFSLEGRTGSSTHTA